MLPKRAEYRNQAILDAAHDEECTMRSPWCNHNRATVVACHFNESWAGKGMGQKADDLAIFFGCSACHAAYDGKELPAEPWHARENWKFVRDWYLVRAYYRTILRLIEKGVKL